MKKKLLYSIYLCLLLPILGFALEKEKAPCVEEVRLNDKMYLALGIGYDSYRALNKVRYRDDELNLFFSQDPNLNLPGMVGDLILGYGRYFSKWHNAYLAVEVSVNGSAADTDYELNYSDDAFIIDADMVVNGGYGLSILPGIKINKISLLYLKLSYNWSMLRIEETVRDNGWSSTEYDTSKTTGGWGYGAGLESAFNDHFSLRTELIHTQYESFNTKLGTEIKPADTQYVLALVYHWG